jgi:flagellar hook assembly protein FlgD
MMRHRWTYGLGLAFLLLTAAPRPAGAGSGGVSFYDPFDGPTLAAGWSWENPSGQSTYALSGGAFTMSVARGNDQWVNINRAPRLLRAQRAAPWTIEARILSNTGGLPSLTGLVLYKDAANWLVWAQLGNGTLELSGLINNAFTQPISTMATKYASLRVRRVGATYYFDASADGSRWTNANLYVDTAGRLEGARYGMLAKDWSGGTGTSYTVSYDAFTEYAVNQMPPVLAGVTNTVQIAKEIGAGAINNTAAVDVCGTDLGSMFELNGKMYIAFGDTTRCPLSVSNIDRSNVLAVSADTNPADGITFDTWITGPDGRAKELFGENPGAITAIPTYGIGVGNTAYLYYMQVTNWSPWTCDRSAIASSSDRGLTWTKHEATASWTAGNFNQVTIRREPPWVYLWGIPCGRYGSVKLMRVDENRVLDKTHYQYFIGYDAAGTPQWAINNEAAAVTVAGGPVGELSVRWDAWLGRYLMAYLDERQGIVMREAPAPWGPWSAPVVVATGAQYPALYGAFVHEWYGENNGESVYFRMSQFFPLYSTYWMRTTLVKAPNQPPVLAPIGHQTIVEGQALTLALSGTDADAEPIAYGASGLPLGATLNPTTGAFAWTPGWDQAGSYPVTFSVADARGAASQQAVTLTVMNAPVAIAGLSDTPDPFSPNGDGVKESTTIQGTFNHSVGYSLQIKTSTGMIVRTFSGLAWAGISHAWDGRNASGVRVADGVYTYVLTGTDVGGSSASLSGTVALDTVAPVLAGLADAPDPFRPSLGQSATISFTLSEPSYVTLRIYNNAGSLVRTLLSNSLRPATSQGVTWNGKNSSGALQPPGIYTYRVWVTDKASIKAVPYPASGTVTLQ